MKKTKKDEIFAKIIFFLMIVGTVSGLAYLFQTDKQMTLEKSMIKAITCIESDYCTNYKQQSDATKWYEGSFEYEPLGKEHQTTLGNADFYRVTFAGDSYFFRVDGSKHLVIQYSKISTDTTEKELIEKYDIH